MFGFSKALKYSFAFTTLIALTNSGAEAQPANKQCPTGKEFQIWASASNKNIKTAIDKALISAKRKARLTCGEFEDDSIKKLGKVIAKVTKHTRDSKSSYEAIVDPRFCCIGASESEVETASNSISELRAVPNSEGNS